jgi:tRNA1(Val) A37 N6-methylase TrmN6
MKELQPVDELTLLDSRLSMLQPVKGHRAGTDAMLLAACLPVDVQGLVIDMGAGIGTVGLVAAVGAPQAQVILIESDEMLLSLAQQNISRNGLQHRARVVGVDVLNAKARRIVGLEAGKAQIILTNPPFYQTRHIRSSPLALKQSAYELQTTLDDWVRAACSLLAPHGKMIIIHRADALPEIIAACAGRFGGLHIKPVYPRTGEAAVRVLVAATKGSRAPLGLLPGIVLHEGTAFTAEAQAIQRGHSRIDMTR